jgi:ArsR family transcriptional regulator
MARWATRVTAIDRSPEVLARGRALAARKGARNIVWKRGDLERVPLRDGSVDLALLSQALHHAEQPARALREALRILKPGGRLLVLDLRKHDEAWVRATLGDRWLGFTDRELRTLLTGAGFDDVRVETGARRSADPFAVIIARAVFQPPAQPRQS